MEKFPLMIAACMRQVGHSDRTGGGNPSGNAVHATPGGSQQDLVGTGGAGLFYCFAIN